MWWWSYSGCVVSWCIDVCTCLWHNITVKSSNVLLIVVKLGLLHHVGWWQVVCDHRVLDHVGHRNLSLWRMLNHI